MLNRRSLRIKVFKNLYSLEQCMLANREVARDRLAARFSPDLNSMEAQPVEELARKRKKALALFNHHPDAPENPEEEVIDEVESARYYEAAENESDVGRFEKAIFEDVDKVRAGQIQVFRLLWELAFQNKKIADERSEIARLVGDKLLTSTRLYGNPAIGRIALHHDVSATGKGVVNIWTGREDLLRDWYKGILGKDESYRSYLTGELAEGDGDLEIIRHIVREIIFKEESIQEYFEEWDLNWSENRPVVRSLVTKSLKTLENSGPLVLADISFTWEEDAVFTTYLYRKTVENSGVLEDSIRKHLENWDLERIALTDKVILKTALCEMMEFPEIPLKVTMNEFIEISKVYSTPKSKSFINGLLDIISADMLRRGMIRKSGRGLIDNK